MAVIGIVEVGPRDGFQSVKEWIPTELKLAVIERLAACGLRKIQVTSFVSPKAIPQMRDAAEVAKTALARMPEVSLFALVPNLRGAAAAHEAGLSEVSAVISLSESHNKANVGKPVDESLMEVQRIRESFPGMTLTMDIATAFGCPFEGEMELSSLLRLIERLGELGIQEFTLCDTIGVAYPKQVKQVFTAVQAEFPEMRFNVHIHDTRNMGILNTCVAIEHGAHAVQTTAGGMGGCPFAPGASGNTATEDLVYVLEKEGLATGIDFSKLVDTARFLKENIQGNYSGHQVNIMQKIASID